MARYEYKKVTVDEMAGPDAPEGIRKVWESRRWEFGWQIRGRSSTIMAFRRRLPPAGPWEAVGEYMAENTKETPHG